jgi:hypothetical protein
MTDHKFQQYTGKILRYGDRALVRKFGPFTILNAWPETVREICQAFDCDPQDVDMLKRPAPEMEVITVEGIPVAFFVSEKI